MVYEVGMEEERLEREGGREKGGREGVRGRLVREARSGVYGVRG